MGYKISKGGNPNMSSLADYMEASYDDLVKAFGEPTYIDEDRDTKVNFEWVLTVEDENSDFNEVVTIYNWKDYDGGNHARYSNSYRWHLGAHKGYAASIFKQEFLNGVSA